MTLNVLHDYEKVKVTKNINFIKNLHWYTFGICFT